MRLFQTIFFSVALTTGYGQTTDSPLFQIFENDKIGFIDSAGQVVVSPAFRAAEDFSEGLAAARLHGLYGYIDQTGHFVIPPQFDYATSFSEGLAIVYQDGQQFFINKQGRKPFSVNFPVVEHFRHGIAKIRTTTEKIGFIDQTGQLVIDTVFSRVDHFYNGMALVEGINHFIYGRGAERYEVGVIDTLGRFLVPYGRYRTIEEFESSFLTVNAQGEIISIDPFSNTTGKRLQDEEAFHKNDIEKFDRSGFKNGLLRCQVAGKFTYVNKRGEIVWQESEASAKQLTNLNIDFMLRGYFYASSVPDRGDLGGFAQSNNLPQEVTDKSKLKHRPISVKVYPDLQDTIDGMFNALTVVVTNTSEKEVKFDAQDGRLDMKVQAKNAKGEWKDIEYLPSSWCGNSYHRLTLKPARQWFFLTPVYEGAFKTKLRIELTYLDPTYNEEADEHPKVVMYSNEYEGSVNPGQFWREQDYIPQGVMSPYGNRR